MKLLGRTTQPEDIGQCIDALRDRFLYRDEQLKHLQSMWATLLSRDVARSAVLYDEAEPRKIIAFGISAPLNTPRFNAVLRDRPAYITKSMLEEWLSGEKPFLDEREYAAANASTGLNIFVLNNGISATVETSALPNVLSKMSDTFLSQYAGCRLRAIAHESFGVPAEFASDLGMQVIQYAQPPKSPLPECPADREPSYIVLMAREHAEQHPGHLTLNTIFLRFSPPRFSFNPTERRLLRYAVEGEGDLRIAELLQIAPRTLKKWWAKIYLAMETVTGIPSGGSSGHRGAESRRHVLRYVREHPEELHAYQARSGELASSPPPQPLLYPS